MDTDQGGTQHWAKWAERNGKLRVGNTQLRSRSRLRSRARSSNPGHAPGKIDRTRFRTAAARLLCRARSRRGATRNKSVLRRGAGSARSGWSDVRRRCVPSSSARQTNAKPVQKMLAHFVPSPVTLGFGEGHVHGTLSSIELCLARRSGANEATEKNRPAHLPEENWRRGATARVTGKSSPQLRRLAQGRRAEFQRTPRFFTAAQEKSALLDMVAQKRCSGNAEQRLRNLRAPRAQREMPPTRPLPAPRNLRKTRASPGHTVRE